jgi:hypothetical protein
MPAEPWSKGPGPIAIPPRSADTYNYAWNNNPKSSRISVGKPRSGCVNAIASSSHAANMPTWSRWRSLMSWQDSCGRLPSRSRSPPKAKTAHDATMNSEGVPTCIGRDAAPVWCNPRQRYEARRGHSSRDRGRHPTAARQVVANPRRAAGSTVGSYMTSLYTECINGLHEVRVAGEGLEGVGLIIS